MKKAMIFLIMFLLFPALAFARNDVIEVDLKKCVDGDTAWFYYNDTEMKSRFLAIDTPESTNEIEEYGKEASDFTCNELMNAKKIELEFDEGSDEIDKYDRYLVWVFVDGELLQKKLIDNGLAEVKYLYGDYKYTSILEAAQEEAKENKVGIWNKSVTQDKSKLIIGIVIIVVLICSIISCKVKNKGVKKVNSKIKSSATKKLRNLLK